MWTLGRSAVLVLLTISFLAGKQQLTEGKRLTPRSARWNSRALEISELWIETYGLRNGKAPPENVNIWKDGESAVGADIWNAENATQLPWAPHLEECTTLTRERLKVEMRDSSGADPPWADVDKPSYPKPPWVKGADDDNLAELRRVQTDIWLHQFPVDCEDPKHKFVVVRWGKHLNHGFGSQIHLMASALNFALAYNRILVPQENTFSRAEHDDCQGANYASSNCYFFPITSPQCERVAMELYKEPTERANKWNVWSLLASDMRLVKVGEWITNIRDNTTFSKWGAPWKQEEDPFEQLGTSQPMTQNLWWRGQAVRFLMRHPSAYLCHLMNRARHDAFGLHVAMRIAAAEDSLRHVTLMSRRASEDEFLALKNINLKTSPLEASLWRNREPYMPRPIVSVHVRLGDKAAEMKLFSMAAHMWLAERLRLHVPHLHAVWLSTEVESVIKETSLYPNWAFYYTNEPRSNGTVESHAYFHDPANQAAMEGSYIVNLMIASECDYFVGTLGSNGPQLVNELRMTSGKKFSGFLTLNEIFW